MVGKGKSAKDHIVQGGSGISPQQKRSVKTPRKRKATLQTSISEWLADDDVGKQATQAKYMKTPPPPPPSHTVRSRKYVKSYTFSALWESRDKRTLCRTSIPPDFKCTKPGGQCVIFTKRLCHMRKNYV